MSGTGDDTDLDAVQAEREATLAAASPDPHARPSGVAVPVGLGRSGASGPDLGTTTATTEGPTG